MHAESRRIPHHQALSSLMGRVMREGLEGLVLKDAKSVYEPGKRHWLKVLSSAWRDCLCTPQVKKDYLAEGSMADSCDLVVLGKSFFVYHVLI